MTYKTKGTCSTMIDIEMEPDQHTIKSVAFTGGCNGNLKGISSLVVGMKAEDAIARLKKSYLPVAEQPVILPRILPFFPSSKKPATRYFISVPMTEWKNA